MRHLIIVIHDSTDQLAGAHIAESDEEAEEVIRAMSHLGPCWDFPLVDGELLQHWEEPDLVNYRGEHTAGQKLICALCDRPMREVTNEHDPHWPGGRTYREIFGDHQQAVWECAPCGRVGIGAPNDRVVL